MNDILNNVSRYIGNIGLKLKKHSPEIMVVAGVTGTVVSAVMACKATLKAGDIIDSAKEDLEKIHKASEMENVDYSEKDMKRDTTIVYSQTAIKFVKLYGPSIILGAASIASIFAGHNITRKRNLALAAAYATVDRSFKEYRSRVIERFGSELDKELKYNLREEEVETIVIDENGEEKKITEKVKFAGHSEYARFFDEYCKGWTKNAELNKAFLLQQQNWANEILKNRGYIFLNEVYEALGMDKTKAGQVVGWVYDKNNSNHDNFVDFGMFDVYNEAARDFVNGRERSILLDFNVDGDIRYIFE